jgi:hypothetical protein
LHTHFIQTAEDISKKLRSAKGKGVMEGREETKVKTYFTAINLFKI